MPDPAFDEPLPAAPNRARRGAPLFSPGDLSPWLEPLSRELGVDVRLADPVLGVVFESAGARGSWRELPLLANDQPVGTLGVGVEAPEAQVQVLLSVLGAFAAQRFAVRDLAQSLSQAWKEANFIDELHQLLQDVFAVDQASQVIIRQLSRLQHAESVSLYLMRDDRLVPVASFPAAASIFLVKPGVRALLAAGDTSVELAQNDAQQTEVCVPVCDGARVLGALCLAGPASLGFAATIRFLSNVATQIARALSQRFLLEQEIVASQVRRELELAAEMQRGLFPKRSPTLAGVQIAARCHPASLVGGDGYDFARHSRGLDIVVADVSGHGFAAGLLMSNFLSMLRSRNRGSMTVARIADLANRHVTREVGLTGHFVTGLYARLDPAARKLTYAALGHHPPLLCRAGEVRSLPVAPGMPAGLCLEGSYSPVEVALEPGDLVLLFTDGLFEVRDPAGQFLGVSGLGEILKEAAGQGPEAVLDQVFAACSRYSSGVVDDDQTAVVLVLDPEVPCAAS